MTDIQIDTASLRKLIGQEVEFMGRSCQVIEILEDGPALILQFREQHTSIQADQHGEAHRTVPTTITLPVLEGDGYNLNPDFSALALEQYL